MRTIKFEDPDATYDEGEILTISDVMDKLEVDWNAVLRLFEAFGIKKVADVYMGNPGRPPGGYLVTDEDLEDMAGFLEEEEKDLASTGPNDEGEVFVTCAHDWEPYRTRVVMDQTMTLQVDSVYCRKCLEITSLTD